MIRIVRARTLRDQAATIDAARRETARALAEACRDHTRALDAELAADEARDREAEALQAAEVAGRRAQTAEQAYEALKDSTVSRLAELRAAAMDPDTGRMVQGELALHVLRDDMARISREGTQEEKDAIIPLQVLLGDDIDPAVTDRLGWERQGVQVNVAGGGVQVNHFGDEAASREPEGG